MNQIVNYSNDFDLPVFEKKRLSLSRIRVLKEEIKALLEQAGALLVAHYYTDEEIQILAEETGGLYQTHWRWQVYKSEVQTLL